MRIGELAIGSSAVLPFARDKLRQCLRAAGFKAVYATQASTVISQSLRSRPQSTLVLELDDDPLQLVIHPADITGRYHRLTLPGPLDNGMIGEMKEILARLSREELLQDLEQKVEQRTAELKHERERSERLLKNMLPESIAERMKAGETIADLHEASVLFADISGFTALARDLSAEKIVDLLDRTFRRFDDIAQSHEMEKIKTIGDCYMAAAGIPEPRADHVDRAVMMGLDLLRSMNDIREQTGLDIDVRIGVHAGPLVAGVIGARKYSYDVWGDTVNVASRMESHGVVGRLQVSDTVKERLGERFSVEDRGLIQIRNRGEIRAWLVNALIPVGTAGA